MHKSLAYPLAAACLLTVAGCAASVPLAPSSEDQAAKAFTAQEGSAGLYVYRPFGAGFIVLNDVIVDGRIIGAVAPDTYVYIEVPPGEHSIAVSHANERVSAKIRTEAGGLYFYRLSAAFGLELEPVASVEAKSEITPLKRAEAL